MTARQYNFGDLVRVGGYDDRIFSVEGWRVEQWNYPDEEWTDVVYELTDVHSADCLEADAEDLALVATADNAVDYLTEHKPSTITKSKGGEVPMAFFGFDLPRKPNVSPEIERYNKQRDRERKVNELLDERNDYALLLAEFGDEGYKEKIAEIDTELGKVE